MNWIQSLYETYDKCRNMIGVVGDESEVPLLPICHTTQKAHIEITLDANGNFRRARVVDKEEARTMIPCTEKSFGRTNSVAPHPLCDKLQYVAGDYAYYLPDANHWDEWLKINKVQDAKLDYKKSIKNRCSYFDSYKKLLSEWVSHGVTDQVRIVHQYIQKRNVVRDLIERKILFIDKLHKFCFRRPFEKSKNASTDIFDVLPVGIDTSKRKIDSWQADAFVRWRVEIGDEIAEVWKNPKIIQSWIDYYSSTKKTNTLCYVTGAERLLADLHPAKIRIDADRAKLISSGKSTSGKRKITIDDGCGFTFLGRFTYPDQVATVGFETTQKAHYALRWLMSRQGYVLMEKEGQGRPKPGLAIVAWAVSGAKAPQPTADTYASLYDTEVESEIADTAQDMAIRLKKKIAGYRQEIGEREDVVVMAVDSATPGRLSIVYYRVLKGSEFLERIEKWHETCAWRHTYHLVEKQDEKGKTRKVSVPFYGAPAPADIAEAAYGSRLEDKLKKATIKRLLPCIVDGQPIPRDLVESVVSRTSNRAGLSDYDWNKALTIACALYRKYQHGKEVFDMGLDETRKTRDYLYGRLLAIADVLEEKALYRSGEKRTTNAARYMQQFSQRPYQTWKQLHEALIPYMVRLGGAHYYKNLIAQVIALNPESLMDNNPLSGEYLIGYYCQREKLREMAAESTPEESTDVNSNG